MGFHISGQYYLYPVWIDSVSFGGFKFFLFCSAPPPISASSITNEIMGPIRPGSGLNRGIFGEQVGLGSMNLQVQPMKCVRHCIDDSQFGTGDGERRFWSAHVHVYVHVYIRVYHYKIRCGFGSSRFSFCLLLPLWIRSDKSVGTDNKRCERRRLLMRPRTKQMCSEPDISGTGRTVFGTNYTGMRFR